MEIPETKAKACANLRVKPDYHLAGLSYRAKNNDREIMSRGSYPAPLPRDCAPTLYNPRITSHRW